MPRVTDAEVRQIITTEKTDISMFLSMAGDYADIILKDKKLEEPILKQIEMWLSAHYIKVSDGGQVVSEKYGDASVTYAGAKGSGLSSTTYGQQVLAIIEDPSKSSSGGGSGGNSGSAKEKTNVGIIAVG